MTLKPTIHLYLLTREWSALPSPPLLAALCSLIFSWLLSASAGGGASEQLSLTTTFHLACRRAPRLSVSDCLTVVIRPLSLILLLFSV